MSNVDNPYMNLIELIEGLGRASNPIVYKIGIITSINPFFVRVNDITLDRNDILINSSLIDEVNHSYLIDVGDKVVLLVSEDKQQFILICKVV